MGKSIFIRLNVTYKCNRNCSYCYVNTMKDIEKITMTDNIIERFGRVYEEHVKKHGHSRYSSVNILGGEPLLYPDKVKKLYKVINNSSDVTTVNISTNGTLLTKDFADWCSKKNIQFSLSLNDLSLKQYEKYIKLVNSTNVKTRCFIGLSEENLLRLKEVLTLCNKYNMNVILRHHHTRSDKEYIEKYKMTLVSVFKWLLKNKMVFNTEFFWEVTSFESLKVFGDFVHSCGYNYFAIDPNGDVRKCIIRSDVVNNINNKNFSIDKVVEDNSWPKYTYKGIEECEKCEYRFLCGGGCPSHKISAYGTSKTISPYCEANKEIIPLLIKLKEMEENQKGTNKEKIFY